MLTEKKENQKENKNQPSDTCSLATEKSENPV